MAAPAAPWLLVFLGILAVQRGSELWLSARNTSRLRARGGREVASGHLRLLVVVHVLFPLALAGEFFLLGARPGRLWPLWLALSLAAQWLRHASMWALGDRWTVGVWVVPGESRVTRGPYRFLRHPNYLGVVLELAAAPLMFGAWRTALVLSLLDLVPLALRVRSEESALREVGEGSR